MRIAVISTPFVAVPPGTYGGTELVVHALVEGLVEAGHAVSLYATGNSRTHAELHFLYAEPIWPPNPLVELNHVSWAMGQIAATAKGFDLIHAHSALALGMSRVGPKIPMVYTLHHEQGEEFSHFYRYFPEVHYIAISQNQRRLETPLPRCDVIYHGLDAGRYLCSKQAEDYVCFVGRFSEVKGPHTAIDAARRAGIPIRIAGEVHPPDEDFFQRELKPRLALPQVAPLGSIGLLQKAPLLQKARALLAPIQWEEPFGLILIEAMLSGCPVVAFPRGSAPELIEPGVTGFLVRSVDEMSEAIRPGGMLTHFDRLKCRDRAVERFSRERLIADQVRLYQRILAEHASGPLPSPQPLPTDV